MRLDEEKRQFVEFKDKLQALVKEYGVELYTEDQKGVEDHTIMAYKRGVFDGVVLGEDV